MGRASPEGRAESGSGHLDHVHTYRLPQLSQRPPWQPRTQAYDQAVPRRAVSIPTRPVEAIG